MSEAQAKETSRFIPMTAEEVIYLQLVDLKENFRDSRKELNDRMDKLDAKIDKQDAKIDKLADKMDSATRHGNIMTASVIGVALSVLYIIFFK